MSLQFQPELARKRRKQRDQMLPANYHWVRKKKEKKRCSRSANVLFFFFGIKVLVMFEHCLLNNSRCINQLKDVQQVFGAWIRSLSDTAGFCALLGGIKLVLHTSPIQACIFLPVTPHTQCRLKLLKQERIKDYLLMEEEFIRNQEQMKPLEEKQEVGH